MLIVSCSLLFGVLTSCVDGCLKLRFPRFVENGICRDEEGYVEPFFRDHGTLFVILSKKIFAIFIILTEKTLSILT